MCLLYIAKYNHNIGDNMKIGIFGDSFAARPGNNASGLEDKSFWCDVIADEHEVDNFAKAGTSLYWSYKLLNEHHHKFDRIILVVTGFGRLYIPNAEHVMVKHAFSISQIKNLMERKIPNSNRLYYSEQDLTILQTLLNYKLYVEDDNQAALFHELLLEKIKKTIPDIIMIPCLKGSMDPLKDLNGIDVNYNSLLDISMLDLDYCGVSFDSISHDKRCAHMSPINNLILGKDLINYIEGDSKKPYSIDISLYKTPDNIPKDTFIKQHFDFY